jgi:hypothetical protein
MIFARAENIAPNQNSATLREDNGKVSGGALHHEDAKVRKLAKRKTAKGSGGRALRVLRASCGVRIPIRRAALRAPSCYFVIQTAFVIQTPRLPEVRT